MSRYFSRLARRSDLPPRKRDASVGGSTRNRTAAPRSVLETLREVTASPSEEPIAPDTTNRMVPRGNGPKRKTRPPGLPVHARSGDSKAMHETDSSQHKPHRVGTDDTSPSNNSGFPRRELQEIRTKDEVMANRAEEAPEHLNPPPIGHRNRVIEMREVHEVRDSSEPDSDTLSFGEETRSGCTYDSLAAEVDSRESIKPYVAPIVPPVMTNESHTVAEGSAERETTVSRELNPVREHGESTVMSERSEPSNTPPRINVQIGEVAVVVRQETPVLPSPAPRPIQSRLPTGDLLRRYYVRGV